MTGGADANTSHFDFSSGQDRIIDFVDDVDTIEISSDYGFATPQDVVDASVVAGDNIFIFLSPADELLLLHAGFDANILLNDIVIV